MYTVIVIRVEIVFILSYKWMIHYFIIHRSSVLMS